MTQNFPKARAVLRHCFRPGLTEANTVAVSRAFENDLIAVFLRDEIVAWNGTPPELANQGKPGRFVRIA